MKRICYVWMLTIMFSNVVPAQNNNDPDVSGETLEQLAGQWYGKIRDRTGGIIMAYRFEIKGNRLVGYADVPEQQKFNMPVINTYIEGKELSFEVPDANNRFTGTIRNNKIAGKTNVAGGRIVSLSLRKGEYSIPYPLDLSRELIGILQGRWVGQLRAPDGIHGNIFRFAVLNDGKFHGYLDNPTMRLWGMKIKKLSLKDGVLKLETVEPSGTFRGELSGNEITGKWTPGGSRMLRIEASYKKVESFNFFKLAE